MGVLAASISTSLAAADKPHAIVIGAGLSGLNSALLLEDQGFRVTVVEARERVGGRLYTLDDIPGRPEAGGNVIGPSYARVIDRARQLGLELVPARDIAGGRENMHLYISGQFIPLKQWAESPLNPLPEKLRGIPPGGLLFSLLRPNPLARPEDWVLPSHAGADRPIAEMWPAFGLDRRAAELANSNNSYGDSLETTNLLQLYHIGAVYSAARAIPGQLMEIAGGNQRLPEAMADALQQSVLTGKEVIAIEQDQAGVLVRCKDGSIYRGDYALATLPAAALRAVEIRPALPSRQSEAIRSLNYAATLQSHFTVDRPYWGMQTPSLWTDTAAGRLFATARKTGGEVSNLTLWITGKNARRFGEMPPEERDKAVKEALYAIYPGARDAVTLQATIDWGSDPYSGGAWAAWLPGQITDYIDALARPHGRLFFAGEHTAVTNTGMEGAMESAERAVTELLASRQELAGADLFIHCQGCHSSHAGEAHKLGPNLAGFYGQPAASRSGYDYSDALSGSGLTWDRATLRDWLSDSQSLVAGNRMIYANALDDDSLEQLLDYLEELGASP